jgi:putative oxidoreductase
MKARDIILLACYFLFTSMFLYAAVSKLMTYQVFVVQMQRQPFSDAYGKFLTWAIPAAEILFALMMVTTAFRKLGLYLSTSLMICFTGYIILVQLRYYGKIPCSCGGAISKLSWTQHLLFNLFFVAIGFLGIYLERRADSLQQKVHLAK